MNNNIGVVDRRSGRASRPRPGGHSGESLQLQIESWCMTSTLIYDTIQQQYISWYTAVVYYWQHLQFMQSNYYWEVGLALDIYVSSIPLSRISRLQCILLHAAYLQKLTYYSPDWFKMFSRLILAWSWSAPTCSAASPPCKKMWPFVIECSTPASMSVRNLQWRKQ